MLFGGCGRGFGAVHEGTEFGDRTVHKGEVIKLVKVL
jgi:hypothetical protein